MNDQLAQHIITATRLEDARREVLRRSKNEKQAKEAYSKTASPEGLALLFPGLKAPR